MTIEKLKNKIKKLEEKRDRFKHLSSVYEKRMDDLDMKIDGLNIEFSIKSQTLKNK